MCLVENAFYSETNLQLMFSPESTPQIVPLGMPSRNVTLSAGNKLEVELSASRQG